MLAVTQSTAGGPSPIFPSLVHHQETVEDVTSTSKTTNENSHKWDVF